MLSVHGRRRRARFIWHDADGCAVVLCALLTGKALATQIAWWVADGWTVRYVVLNLGIEQGLTLLMLALENCLAYGSSASVAPPGSVSSLSW